MHRRDRASFDVTTFALKYRFCAWNVSFGRSIRRSGHGGGEPVTREPMSLAQIRFSVFEKRDVLRRDTSVGFCRVYDLSRGQDTSLANTLYEERDTQTGAKCTVRAREDCTKSCGGSCSFESRYKNTFPASRTTPERTKPAVPPNAFSSSAYCTRCACRSVVTLDLQQL